MWVFGKDSLGHAFMEYAPRISLVGVVQNINVPFLVAHGANDRQIPIEYARQSYDEAVNSPMRELKIFTEQEGGNQTRQRGQYGAGVSYIADWVAQRFTNAMK